jgi:hypothetical protein
MLRSAIVLLCMVALVNAGGLKGAAPRVPKTEKQPEPSAESSVLNHAAEVGNNAARVPLPLGGPYGMTKGGYVPQWSHQVLNNNVKAIKDNWAAQEGKLGYYNGHFGYNPSVHPDLQGAVVPPGQYGLQGIQLPPALQSAYKGNVPANLQPPTIPTMPYMGQPSEKLDAMKQINDATAQAKQQVAAAQNMVPVTLANGIRMNVPSGEANALGIPAMPTQNGRPVIDANKLLGTPITLPGTPEHYKDVTTRILNEQANVGAQIAAVQAVETQHAQRAAYLGAMMHQLQQQYLQAQHLDHLQKTYMEKMARRNAALGIDRHRVQNEYSLGGLLNQYNSVKAYEQHVRSVVSQIDTVKQNLMKEIMTYRQSIRKDTNAIKELLDGKLPTASGASGPEGKLEKEEQAALALGEKAADQQKKADTEAVKANDEFISHVESALNKGPGGDDASGASGSGSSGSSGASGSA